MKKKKAKTEIWKVYVNGTMVANCISEAEAIWYTCQHVNLKVELKALKTDKTEYDSYIVHSYYISH